MGKVLKAVAGIALAVGVAVAAPYLAGMVFAHGTMAFFAATAAIGVVLGGVAGFALQAIGYAPADAPSGIRRPSVQRDASGMRFVEVAPTPPEPVNLEAIEPTSIRWAFFWPWQRHTVIRAGGDCMMGVISPKARWALVSRLEAIRPGDLFAFDIDDLWTAYQPDMRWRWWRRITAVGMIKRYLGLEAQWGRIIFDCTNPPTECETGRNHVRYAYRVLSMHHSPVGAWRAAWRLKKRNFS